MLNLLRRDLRSNILFWLAALSSHGLFLATLVFTGRSKDSVPALLAAGDALCLTAAAFALVHGDSPSAPLSDWRTRPVSPAQVAGAKLASLLGIILLPKLLIGVLSAPWFTMTYSEALSGTLLRLVIDLSMLAAAFALAAATRSVRQAAIAVCALLITLALALVASKRLHGDDLWFIGGYVAAAAAAGLASIVLFTPVRAVFVRAGILAIGVFWPWLTLETEALWAEKPTRLTAETQWSTAISVVPKSIDNYQIPAPEVRQADGRGVYMEFNFTGPKGTRVLPDRFATTILTASGSATPKPGYIFGISGGEMGESLSAELSAQALPKHDDERLRIDIDFLAFRPVESAPLPPLTGALQRVAAVGSCGFTVLGKREKKDLYCLSVEPPPCIAATRRMSDCSDEEIIPWIRWPSPYLVKKVLSVDAPEISIWKREGRLHRSAILTRAQVEAVIRDVPYPFDP